MSLVQGEISKVTTFARKTRHKIKDDERGVTVPEFTNLIGNIADAVILAAVFAGNWVASRRGALIVALTCGFRWKQGSVNHFCSHLKLEDYYELPELMAGEKARV